MTYIAQPGDTLYTIAQRFNTSAEAIMAANNRLNSYLIYPGQLLEIPEEPESEQLGYYYIVQPGDSLYRIAQRFNIPLKELIRVNQIPPPYTIYPDREFSCPVWNHQTTPKARYIVQPGDTLYSIAENLISRWILLYVSTISPAGPDLSRSKVNIACRTFQFSTRTLI